jgi:hypothetical protein
MKRVQFLALALCAGLVSAACSSASGQIRLFQRDPAPAGPDQDTVQALICSGNADPIADALLYLERRGASPAEATERVE